MEEKREIYKMFHSPHEGDCDGFFCIYETRDAFWGYKIQKEPGHFAAKIYLAKKKPSCVRYINCDRLYEFPKTVKYEKLFTRYRLKELRDALDNIRVGKVEGRIINVKDCEINDYDTTTPEQRKNRQNPEYHDRLKKAKMKLELAVLQNNKEAEKELLATIDELNAKLGYRDTQRIGKYQKQFKDTVTNFKPMEGGACIPK